MRIKKIFLSNLTSHPIAKIGFTVMVFFASVAVVAAWTEPSFSPTDCDSGTDGCNPPVNVGSGSQVKSGDFRSNSIGFDDNEPDNNLSPRGDGYTYLRWDSRNSGGPIVIDGRPTFYYWDDNDNTLRYLIDTGNMKNLNATFNEVHSPRYYDRNNDFYYTDPASTSRINRIHSEYIGAGGIRGDSRVYATGANYGIWANGSTMGGRFEDTGGTSRTYLAYGSYGIYQNLGSRNYFGGRVGINDTTPNYDLDVNGTTNLGSTIYHRGTSYFYNPARFYNYEAYMYEGAYMGNERVRAVASPVYNSDAATKGYVDSQTGSLSTTTTSSTWAGWIYNGSRRRTVTYCPSGYVRTGCSGGMHRYRDSNQDWNENYSVAELEFRPYSSNGCETRTMRRFSDQWYRIYAFAYCTRL
ncbi:MAG: hypothetical protein U5L75_03460 [Candidatus Campbellbacteria bacterium]|nr:hypothetical protein [Candidatus Campbellbacteria bacterium]